MRTRRISYDAIAPVKRGEAARINPVAGGLAIAGALALQVLLPTYFPLASKLDLPLLVLVYIALGRRNVLFGLALGTLVGISQDGLTHGPVGLFGIIKGVVGYIAASISLYIEVDYPGARSVLAAMLFLVHQVLFWVLEGALLGGVVLVDPAQTLILAAIHAGLSLILYHSLDGVMRSR